MPKPLLIAETSLVAATVLPVPLSGPATGAATVADDTPWPVA